MTRSRCCWFIIDIWKSDHHLNMTPGTNIKFTLTVSQLSIDLLNHCVDESELCLISRFKSFEAKTIWIQMGNRGLSGDVDSAVLSVSHTSVTSTFQGWLLLSNSCWTASFCSWFMTPKPCPFAQIKSDTSAHAGIFTAWRYAFGNWDFNSLIMLRSLIFDGCCPFPLCIFI